ncbi:MAG: hypothetical protein H6713_12890 [Myxococcales bacterium]|nr:hypothetical protein [Myxococcales bacterium]
MLTPCLAPPRSLLAPVVDAAGPPLTDLAVASLGLLAFFFGLLLLSNVLPGRVVKGFRQADGARKTYLLNGMALWVLTHMIVITGTLRFGLTLSPLLTRYFWPLFIAANLLAVGWTLQLYLRGRARAELSPGLRGLLHDLWMGVELNPSWRRVDLKLFAYQPSLIGLWLLVLASAYYQHETLGYLTPQMVLYQVFWWFYLTTHYRAEPGLLSMWDIIAERFGFMLVWGDLAFVPFFYSVAGWYIATQPAAMSTAALLGLVLLFAPSLWIFRGANAQKHQFKLDRDAPIWGRPPRLVGGRLLASGFWGIGRKLNYTGELGVYFAIALTSGLASPWPYAVPFWLLCLLTHRAWRDDLRCRAKYGPLWEEYCERVRFRMLPFLY